MKKIIMILIVPLLLACVTSPDQKADSDKTAVKREITLLSRVTSLFSDGFVDTYRTFTYEKGTNLLIKEDLFSADDELLETVKYTYNKQQLVKKQTLDAGRKLVSFHEYGYYPSGLLHSEKVFNDAGKEQNSSVFDYDGDGNRTEWNVYDGFGSLLASSRYIYEDGNRKKVEMLDADRNLVQSIEFIYSGNNKTRENYYMDNNALEKYIVFDYEGDRLLRESTFDAQNALILKVEYEYDKTNDPSKIIYFDGDGKVTEIVERTYVTAVQ
ncbi:MAG: hypothetical protein JW969_21440 [Spirochaetales bacterium]|nr:hypothetical protein [Spirochaetales bacterium]